MPKLDWLFPGAQLATEQEQFAEVVGVVVGSEQDFAEDGLAVAVGERGEEIGGFVFYDFDHGFKVGAERGCAFAPGSVVGRGLGFWPVAGGEFGRNVPGVARELQDVPLGEAHVLQHFPRGVRGAFRLFPLQVCRPIFYRAFEIDVGVAASEKFDEMLRQGFLFSLIFHA